MGKSRRKPKRRKKTPNLFIFLIVVAVLIAIFFLPSVRENIGDMEDTGPSETTEPSTEKEVNCGDLQIDLDSIKEAMSYTRSGLVKPAVRDFKFLILDLTVTNKGDFSKDFSGHKLRLTADGGSYIPFSFSKIDKITLLDDSTIDYVCAENKLASISRIVLEAEESERGCKIFQVPENSTAKSLSVYHLERLKCVIQL